MNTLVIKLALMAFRIAIAYLTRKQAEMTAEQRAEVKKIMDQPEGERWYERKTER